MGRSRFPHLLLPKAHFFLLIGGLPKGRREARKPPGLLHQKLGRAHFRMPKSILVQTWVVYQK
jgi:hypothetical protein